MTEPLSSQIINSELNDETIAWVLCDTDTMRPLIIPPLENLNEDVSHFFLKKEDAEEYGRKLFAISKSPIFQRINLGVGEVMLLQAIRQLYAQGIKSAVHTPNEMFVYFDEFGDAS